jgi:hypothetical protein
LERAHEANATIDVDGLLAQGRGAAWCALVDGKELYVNGNGVWSNESPTCMTYNVFYSVQFLQRQFPRATIHRPVNGEMQHCCIIRRET